MENNSRFPCYKFIFLYKKGFCCLVISVSLLILVARVTGLANFLKVQCVNISFFIHQVVAWLILDLNTSVALTFVLNDFTLVAADDLA